MSCETNNVNARELAIRSTARFEICKSKVAKVDKLCPYRFTKASLFPGYREADKRGYPCHQQCTVSFKSPQGSESKLVRYSPTPVPRFSLTEKENEEVCVAKPGRGRFAKLAQDINSWEDDLTHVNLQKPEEPKQRWQPPRPTPADDQSMAESVPSAPCIPSLKTKHAPCPPTVSSPQKKRAPEPPILVCPSYGSDSPQTSRFVSPKNPASRSNVHHEIKKAVDQLPVNARGLDESSSPEEPAEEPTQKPVLERMASWKKVTDTPKSAKPVDPALQSMSAKLASWEQKVTQTPKSERSVATGSTVNMPMKQFVLPSEDQSPNNLKKVLPLKHMAL
ncbi:hypothetical protein ScPMuIL_001371 [Solemya velum]